MVTVELVEGEEQTIYTEPAQGSVDQDECENRKDNPHRRRSSEKMLPSDFFKKLKRLAHQLPLERKACKHSL